MRRYTVELEHYIPSHEDFNNYMERPVDKRLAVHYDAGKHPLTMGKQGTGKTLSHMYYAYKNHYPFLLFNCHVDFKLTKLCGDKTIIDGSIVFQESIFIKAIQIPSVILFDEINAVSNANTFDFHSLLQNHKIFVADADNGKGAVYKLHPECKIGFAQNPTNIKYLGGNIRASNFLSRCTFINFPEFTKKEVYTALLKRFSSISKDYRKKFIRFYFACVDAIEQYNIPVDISTRQLNHVVDLWQHGLTLKDAIEDGMLSFLEAISQPQVKETFLNISRETWGELVYGRAKSKALTPLTPAKKI